MAHHHEATPTGHDDTWTKVIAVIDATAKPLILFSVVMFLIEKELSLQYGWSDSYQAPPFFLWSERCVAFLFTMEVVVRWWRSNPLYYGAPNTSYPFNIWGLIDILAVLPFWIGFLCPIEYLGLVRTLRTLRLLKFFRYSRGLQLTALKFYRAYHNLKGLAFSIGVLWLFFAIVCLELEQPNQPDKLGTLVDVAWFTIVTGTTVGYGDASPSTFYGKLFVGLMLVPIIGSIGMAISAFSNACDAVQELEDDPAIDPLDEWRKERERMRARRKLNRAYRMLE